MSEMSLNRVDIGDCRAILPTLPAETFQCCVTSPPYWGLRDYGHTDQIGHESTPEEYVAELVGVFREVRRVLRDDGTCWLNLGDSYCGAPGGSQGKHGQRASRTFIARIDMAKRGSGLKPKDLVGIPWRVAFALQQPYYTGTIRNECDRVWLAAMLDAEGCIFIHKRKAGQSNGQGYERQSDSYGPGVEIANTSRAIIDRIMALVGKGSICSQTPEQSPGRKQTIHRWNLRTIECRDFLRELHPYLVAKQQQARIAVGCPSSGEIASAAHLALISLHGGSGTTVDFPAPKPMTEAGWYLRSDVIWSKANPMPESVTDRPTKAHEYVFLLSKSERYFYDESAIREPVTGGAHGGARLPAPLTAAKCGTTQTGGKTSSRLGMSQSGLDRNARTVWTIPSEPYTEAHFATMPTSLVTRCILAGSSLGSAVLDPFMGSGTVGQVAESLGRRWFGCELNADYGKLSADRTRQTGLVFGMEKGVPDVG